MNVIFLTICMTSLSFFIYIRNELNFIVPSLWISLVFDLSLIVYCFNLSYFQKDLSITVCLVIFFSVLLFYIGEVIGSNYRLVLPHKNQVLSSSKIQNRDDFIVIPQKKILLIYGLFILMISLYRLYDMYMFTKSVGNSNFLLTVYYIRGYMTAGDFNFSTLVILFSSVAEAAGYIVAYYFVKYFFEFKKVDSIYLFSVFTFLFYQMTTTGRTGFLKFFIILMAIFFYFYKISLKKINIAKIQKIVLTIIIIMVGIFVVYGRVVRRSDKGLSDYFRNYFSAGLFGLQSYFDSPWEANVIKGQYTLSNYYYYLNKIFKTNHLIAEHHLPFYSMPDESSNIYTALVLPIQDYGIVGMLITRLLMGWIMAAFIKRAFQKHSLKVQPLYAIVFGYIFYICFFFPIADRFVELLTVTSFPLFLLSLYMANIGILKFSRKISGGRENEISDSSF